MHTHLLIEREDDTNTLLGVAKSLLHAHAQLAQHFKKVGFEDDRTKGMEKPTFAFLPLYPLSDRVASAEITPMLESLSLHGSAVGVARCILIVAGDPAISLDTGVYLLTLLDC